MRLRASIMTLTACAALGACQAQTDDTAEPGPASGIDSEPTPSPTPSETVSILRPDVEAEQGLPPALLEPLDVTIGFPAGGSELDDAALAALAQLAAAPQIERGGPITLRGHSDAGGNDAVNMRISEQRAEAVRDWLVKNGVDEGRVTIIAFGEQNPVEPNARPDGSPNEDGRAANRRVEIYVTMPVEVIGAPPG